MNLTPPQDPIANVLYRQQVRKWALKHKRNRDWLLKKCADDWFFWCETFAWLYEPRPEPGRKNVIPFIPWTHQKPEISKMLPDFNQGLGLGFEDFGIEKARGEGATWSCLMIILHQWLFREYQAFGIVSRHELAADNPEDPDSLGWKLDWQLTKLPLWMAGAKGRDFTRNISKHTWINQRNNSSITAYPCTGDLASGGRKTAFFMDEMAKFDRGPDEDAISAVEPVTNSLLLVSTYDGADGAYYRMMREDSTMRKLILDWKRNPTRNQNMFRVDVKKKKLIVVKPDLTSMDGIVYANWDYIDVFFEEHLPTLRRRGFEVDSKTKIWSPWYVSRCLRPGMTPKKIAQEYDRDPGGSGSRFFAAATIEMLVEQARQPSIVGEIECNWETLTFDRLTRTPTGHLKLWCSLRGKDKLPPPGNYVIGGDIASGQGGDMSSNSVLSILNRDTGEKVGEYANPQIKPEKLAELAVVLCRWFASPDGGPAYLIWEGNGYGGSFRDRILETDFRNFHWRTPWKSTKKKPTKEPGWWSNKDSKRDLLGKYRWSLTEGFFSNPNAPALKECLCYVNGPGGKVEFVSGMGEEDDPANSGENHGDRVIADALANYGMEELNGGTAKVSEHKETQRQMLDPPAGSFRARQLHREKERRKKSYW